MIVRFAWYSLLNQCGALVLISILAGCAMTPSTSIQGPLTTRPKPALVQPTAAGSIFQNTQVQAGHRYVPLFEDRRARAVGDTIIVTLNERTNASKSSGSNIDRSGAINFSVPDVKVAGKSISFLQGASLDANSNNTFDGKGASSSNNDFTGTITVTVMEVLANGNLLVSGEKQIGINQGQEFIRLSGVVNPINILDNTISSVQVADARLEYRANGYIDEAQTMGWLSRFFLTVSPF